MSICSNHLLLSTPRYEKKREVADMRGRKLTVAGKRGGSADTREGKWGC